MDYSKSSAEPSRTTAQETDPAETAYNDHDMLIIDTKDLRTLIPGLMESQERQSLQLEEGDEEDRDRESVFGALEERAESSNDEGGTLSPRGPYSSSLSPVFASHAAKDSMDVPVDAPFFSIATGDPSSSSSPESVSLKTATCKQCGALISRDMEAIEAHMEECSGLAASG